MSLLSLDWSSCSSFVYGSFVSASCCYCSCLECPMFLAVTHHMRMRCQSLNVTFLPFNILQRHFLHYYPQPPTYCYNTEVNARTCTLYKHIY